MPILPYAKESTKPFNDSLSANNDTTLHSNANESIERKIGYDSSAFAVNKTNADNQATITDEKPVKSNVFRDIDDAKKIQSNAKDIEDESTNILQARRNIPTNSGTTTTTTTTTEAITESEKAAAAATNQTLDSISLSANGVLTTEQTLLPQATNQTNVANNKADGVPQKRHRRHRQQR